MAWSKDAQTAFDKVKQLIEQCPHLFFVDAEAPITLQTDASDYGIGGYLFQTVDGAQRPVMFLSKSFTRPQLRWSTYEKEAYAIVYCLKSLDYLLRDVHFTLQTDHRNLLFIKESSSAKVIRWKMLIAEYNYTFEHIPGTTNVVADAMSRLILNPKDDLEKEIGTTVDPHVRANLLGTLHFIDIPQDKYDILSQFHNEKVGHYGFEHTLRTIRQHGHNWKYIRSHLKKFIRECPMCQKMSPLITDVSAIRFTTAEYEPFARISMDTIGPLPESDEGYQFILVIIDCFTRMIELYPCKTTDAEEASHYLIEFISRYGTPDQVLSDRGTQFANNVIKSALTTLGAEHILSLANSKQELAIVERANKEVMRFIIPMVYECKHLGKWVQFLPLVRRILVTHPHDSTGIAPATLLYGSMVQLEKGIFPEGDLPESSSNTLSVSRSDATWIDEVREKQHKLLEIAQLTQRQLDAEHLATRTARSEPITEFPVGTYVLALYKDRHAQGKGRPPNKLLTIKRGPYKVISHNENTYLVQNLAHHDDIREFHVKELQPFEFDAIHTDPFLVALGDEQEFIVETVVRHELRTNPTGRHRKQLYLLIKWEGYDETHNSWEPINHLFHLPLIREYLQANRLSAYIPASYRNKPERNTKPRRYNPRK
jgi:hypothetical protein